MGAIRKIMSAWNWIFVDNFYQIIWCSHLFCVNHTLSASRGKINIFLAIKELQVTSYKLQVTSYKLQVTSYKLQVTSYKLQDATNPVTCNS